MMVVLIKTVLDTYEGLHLQLSEKSCMQINDVLEQFASLSMTYHGKFSRCDLGNKIVSNPTRVLQGLWWQSYRASCFETVFLELPFSNEAVF